MTFIINLVYNQLKKDNKIITLNIICISQIPFLIPFIP